MSTEFKAETAEEGLLLPHSPSTEQGQSPTNGAKSNQASSQNIDNASSNLRRSQRKRSRPLRLVGVLEKEPPKSASEVEPTNSSVTVSPDVEIPAPSPGADLQRSEGDASRRKSKRTCLSVSHEETRTVRSGEAAIRNIDSQQKKPKSPKNAPVDSNGPVNRRSKKPTDDALSVAKNEDFLRRVESLSPNIKSRFGEVVWARQKGYCYWPALVYDPRYTARNIRKLAQQTLQSKFIVLFYESNTFAAIPFQDIVPFADKTHDYRAGFPKCKGLNKLKSALDEAIAQADDQASLPLSKRVRWEGADLLHSRQKDDTRPESVELPDNGTKTNATPSSKAKASTAKPKGRAAKMREELKESAHDAKETLATGLVAERHDVHESSSEQAEQNVESGNGSISSLPRKARGIRQSMKKPKTRHNKTNVNDGLQQDTTDSPVGTAMPLRGSQTAEHLSSLQNTNSGEDETPLPSPSDSATPSTHQYNEVSMELLVKNEGENANRDKQDTVKPSSKSSSIEGQSEKASNDRLLRLKRSLEKYSQSGTNFDRAKALKALSLLSQTSVDYEALRSSDVAALVSTLRKSEDEQISKSAKALRKMWIRQLGITSPVAAKGDQLKDSPPKSAESPPQAETSIQPSAQQIVDVEEDVNDPLRKRALELIAAQLPLPSVAESIEAALFRRFKECNTNYFRQLRIVMFEYLALKDRRERVLNGTLSPVEIAFASIGSN